MNIEKIYDDLWGVIICSHVLEHVDDVKALSETYRALRDNGILIVVAPIIEGWKNTYENKDINTDHEREEHFGQNDHVRYYGSDIREKIILQGLQSKKMLHMGRM